MHRLQFHLDPVSPYAYLAFEALPQVLEGCSHVVEYRPLLFAGLLQHHEGVNAGVNFRVEVGRLRYSEECFQLTHQYSKGATVSQ